MLAAVDCEIPLADLRIKIPSVSKSKIELFLTQPVQCGTHNPEALPVANGVSGHLTKNLYGKSYFCKKRKSPAQAG
jgi:hypothetical protein